MAIRHEEAMIVNGRLTQAGVSFRSGTGENFARSAVYQCQCGALKIILQSSVKTGKALSCGCLRSEQLATRSRNNTAGRVHNQSGSKITKRTGAYVSWAAMKSRCNSNRQDTKATYADRGISVCERWKTFELFYADMGDRPDGLTIERIDNSKGYEPDNCRWATKKEQARNRRTNSSLTIGDTTKLKVEWAEENGAVQVETIAYRLRRGLPPEQAVFNKRKAI